jgi:hypothetical protein
VTQKVKWTDIGVVPENAMTTLVHEGSVVWDDGAPIEGALVAVTSGTAPTPEIAIRTGPDGSFKVALPNGLFHLEARAPNGRTGVTDVLVDDAHAAPAILILLERE